jgi:hypothetical protein
LGGEIIGVVLGIHARWVRTASPVWRRVAAVALLHVLAKAFGHAPQGVASEHAKTRSKGRGSVGVWRRVVQCDACIVAVIELIRNLGDAFVGSIAGFEIDVGCPIITWDMSAMIYKSDKQLRYLKSSRKWHVLQVAILEISVLGIDAENAFYSVFRCCGKVCC